MKIDSTLQVIFSRYDVRVYAVALSCLFSLIIILSNPVPNNDAFHYLRAAELFSSEGITAVLDHYGWFGYSVLIALLNGILPGSFLAAAYLLNIATYALLIYVFITLAAEYRNTGLVKVFAALVILIYPLINEMRFYLVRDFGFWAFCLTALLQLVRYHRGLNFSHAAGWCLAMLAAIFFRLEGIVLLLVTPLSILMNTSISLRARVRAYFTLQGILLMGVGTVFLVGFMLGIDLLNLMQYAYRYYLPSIFDLSGILMGTADQLNQVLFTAQNFPGNSSHGLVILIIGYVYTVAVNLVNALGIPVSILFLYGLVKKQYSVSRHAWLPAVFFIAGSLLSLIIFMFIMHFLTQRYAALACIIIISFLPLCLEAIYLQLREANSLYRFRLILGFSVFYFLADSLISFGYSKHYIIEAAEWSRSNLEADTALHTNNYSIAYFSGKIPEFDQISLDARDHLSRLAPGDILAAEVDHEETETLESLNTNPRLRQLTRFSNTRNDQIIIYQYLDRSSD